MKSSPGSGAGGTAISEPRLALPKGGGAVSGIGEKFAANPVTGSGSMTVPIAVSPGRAGFGPALSLAYDSATGNGPFGFGWGLGLSAITRKTDKGVPQYAGGADPDVFILAGAEDLVPELAGEPGGLEPRRETRAAFGATYEVSRYRPRIEGLFARIERWTSASDPADTFWRSISRDNVTTWYGRTPESRVFDPADPRRTFNWLVCETHDDRGNVVSYGYKPEDSQGIDPMQLHERNRTEASRSANRYLKRIRYGNRLPYFPDLADSPRTPLPTDWCFEVVFDYGEHDAVDPHPVHEPQPWMRRNDPLSSYRAGFEVRTYRLCQRVLMFHHFAAEPEVGENCLVRATELEYSFEADPADARNPVYSFLIAATQAGFRRRAEGGLRRSAMPAIEFEYSQPVIDDRIRDVDPESLRNLPHGVDGVGYRWIDLDGDGVPGILADQGERWHYKRNESPAVDPDDATGTSTRFGPLQVLLAQASHAAPGATQLLDLAGDGSVDLVELEGPAPGFCERTPEGGWSGHTPFRSLPAIAWSDPNVRFIDLTGDGHADVLVTENDAWCWHASLAETGFGPAQRAQKALDDETGPRVAFADTTQSIFLADLSGDGLTDIVRIRNGEVCYWPNLGHGRFGAKVGMDHAPWFDAPDAFDPRRIHLADIDGSGTTDIVYLSGTGVRIYFNQSGNGWSPARRLAQFPASDSVASATVVDLLGNGTACLVWSSPLAADSRRPMRYIDLMGGQKPHLLVTARNNLGAETQVRYAPSTRFYMQDRAAGTTWPTRLPFPVHVVERVETIDRVSGNRFVTRYRYRHGFFDGPEREFRGFGRVDQWDTETIGALRPDDTEATNIDAASYVPPVHTRTWFHTGAWLDDPAISRQFAAEYYREPSLDDAEAHAQLLADTILPAGLTFQEAREACRALKGSMLRQEVYAEDGSPHAAIPYTVSEQSFAIAPVQPRGGNRHAVFFVHQRESISLQYERNPADPRVAHRLMLAVDDFGNVLRSAEIAYGRRQADAALLPQDRDRQTLPLATVDDNDFTNAVDLPDAYRTPAPSQTRRHELTGLVLSDGQDRLTFEEVEQAIAQAQDIPHEATPDGSRQRRLIAQSRTLYRPNDLSGALPLGQVESLGLPFETRRLVFTPGLPAHVFGDRVDEAMLAEGGYVHGEPDGDWWVPSDRSFLSPDTSDTADVEFTFARQHFFQMQRRQDPFGNVATVGYDAHDLLLITTRDALNNTREAINDYRVLQPRLVTDANGNRTEAAFDTLGVVVGIAVMGKPDEGVGDSLQGLAADLDDETVAAHLETPLVDPHSILQGATTRVVYDLFAYERTQADAQPQPAVVYTLSRATHRSDLGPDELTRVRHAFAYADGFGREIQKKAQAESGPVDADVLNPRWVGSGWTVFNNKGKPVRQFEPFFSATHRFEFDRQQGVGSVLFYDPLERVVATLQPNHTWEKVVFDPWRQATWDANDTVLIVDPADDPDVGDLFRRLPTADYLPTWHAQRIDGSLGSREQSAARKTAVHANTPATAHLDPLGRPFLTVAHNRFERDGTTVDEDHSTRVELDIDGRQRSVRDAIVQAGDPLGRIVVRRDYDMLGNPVHSASMEAGERWTLGDVAGTPIRAWDSRGHAVRTEYDALRRPLRQFVRGHDPHDPTAELLFGRTDYGEGEPDETPNNLRTRVVRLFDSAGIETRVAYDYKGNVLRSHRRFAAEYRSHPDWAGEPTLEPEQFDTSTTYDALDRAVAIITPDGSVTRPAYNEANLLERLTVNLRAAAEATLFVANVDYNAKGQRTRIEHGNGVSTTYEYDDRTFRLVRIHTRRGGDVLQDLSYTFDPVGNVSDRRDEAQQTIWFDNTVVEPHADYTYDAVYRLVAATGREHIGQLAASHTNWNDEGRVRLPHPHDGQAMRRYTERYEYDAAGNFLRFIHQANQGDWTRSYGYEEPSLVEPQKRSNRLSQTAVGASSETYAHDAHGNITTIPHLSLMRWDFQDRLQATARQVVNDGTPQTSRYVYDSNGQRVRKITERQTAPGEAPSRMNERLYLGGFEVYRDYTSDGGTVALERQTLHVIDDQHRLARVETRTQGSDGTPAQLVRYQFGDHLESACVELDADAAIVSYEEFHPFGSTAYQAGRSPADVTSKRHRYTAKERDEESGFCYHGARYYAPWLGRWTAADPMPARAASNLYLYTDDRPTAFVDDNGAEKKKPPFLDQGKSYERVWFDHYKNHPRVTEVFQQQTIKDPKTGKTQKFEGVSKRSPDLWMKVKDGPTTVVEVGRQGKTFESPEKLRQMSIDRDAVKRGLYIGPAEGPQFKIEAQMQKSGLPIVGKGGNAHLADEAPQPEHFDEEKVKRNKEKIAAAKEAKAASLADEAADEAGEFSKYAKKGVKWGSRVVPVLGAIVTLTATGDASAAERVVRAVAGEIGIGPVDLETAYDLTVLAGEKLRGTAVMGLDEVKFHTGTLDDPVRDATRLMEVVEQSELRR